MNAADEGKHEGSNPLPWGGKVNRLTGGMREELRKVAMHDANLNSMLNMQKVYKWSDLMTLYQALLFQTQCLKSTMDSLIKLTQNGPPPQYLITTQEHYDELVQKLPNAKSYSSADTANNSNNENNKGGK